MLKVVSLKICPFVQRVTALLEAKSIPYEVQYISLSDKPQWFSEVSPNGQVPVLLTENGVALFESDAIVEYIDDISSPLEEGLGPEQRAINRAWSYQATKHYLSQCSVMRSSDSVVFAERSEKLSAVFQKMESAFAEGPFFNGAGLGNVDIAWLPLLHRADIIRRNAGHDFLSAFPKLKAWQTQLMATTLAEKSVSEDFEQVFTDFYLSSDTYLGSNKTCEAPSKATGCC